MPILYKGNLVERLHPGSSTAGSLNVMYRLSKLSELNLIKNRLWLDLGCNTGGYCRALLEFGAQRVVGVDLEVLPISDALNNSPKNKIGFALALAEELPFPDKSFEGVLLNEVLEHVIDEADTLRQVFRVLRPGGTVAVFSPNRFFPFEGHGMKIGNRTAMKSPAPFLPWLPSTIGNQFMNARNYWPRQLEQLVHLTGFQILCRIPVLMVMEFYPYLPKPIVKWYQEHMGALEAIPVLRQFLAVSTLVVGTRP